MINRRGSRGTQVCGNCLRGGGDSHNQSSRLSSAAHSKGCSFVFRDCASGQRNGIVGNSTRADAGRAAVHGCGAGHILTGGVFQLGSHRCSLTSGHCQSIGIVGTACNACTGEHNLVSGGGRDGDCAGTSFSTSRCIGTLGSSGNSNATSSTRKNSYFAVGIDGCLGTITGSPFNTRRCSVARLHSSSKICRAARG